jgi:hypothetical protein
MQHLHPLIATLDPKCECLHANVLECLVRLPEPQPQCTPQRAPQMHLTPHRATVHTLPYLRTSPLLLSALLTVSAKYFLQRHYPALLSHTQSIVNRAVGQGQCDIGLIQALILMITWKDPKDGSSWVKLGIAIRLGYQLGMHIQRKDILPRDTIKARQVVDIERTWYTLSCEWPKARRCQMRCGCGRGRRCGHGCVVADANDAAFDRL